ncbi:MAG: cation transporter [Nitrospinae bacterium]|nr:cation transporter [Nitrospinota bacterium]
MKNKTSENHGYKSTAISALSDLGLAVGKFAAGTLGNSSALIADALHSLSDLATDFITYVSIKVSHKEPDAEHPYGHGLAETIGTVIIGVVVAVVGIGIMWEEQKHFSNPGATPHEPTMIALSAALASIAVKEFLFQYTLKIGMATNSDSVVANAWHHRSDSLASLAAAVGIGGSMMGYKAMDPLAAMIVGLLILHMGWKITWEAGQDLMERGLSEDKLRALETIIQATPGVLHHHDIRTRKAGRDTFVDVHIQVHPRISVSEAHNIAESVRRDLRKKAENITDVMIHIDAEDDREGRLYRDRREQVEKIVDDALAPLPGLKRSDPVVIHYSMHQIAAEVSLESSSRTAPGDMERLAAQILSRLVLAVPFAEVVIREKLGEWKSAAHKLDLAPHKEEHHEQP